MSANSQSPLAFNANFLDTSRVRLYTDWTLRSIFAGLESQVQGPVIDIGSGTGYFLAAFEHLVGHARPGIRVDIDRALLAVEGGERVCASGAALPLRGGSADVVLIHFVLSRLPRALTQPILEEAARVLRPGGHLLAVEPCLGLTTYHSPSDDDAGRLMGIARRMKAQFQSQQYDIDENFGLALPSALGALLEVRKVDLHVARWYTAFPESPDPTWMNAARERKANLSSRDAVADFIDAHGASGVARPPAGPGLIADADSLELTVEGFERIQDLRVQDLDRATAAGSGDSGSSVEFIPVVSLLGQKRRNAE